MRRWDRWLLVVLGVVALGYLAMAPRVFDRLKPITGDEPFYVMTAISIARDHDIDETNNYQQRDYDEIFPRQPLPPDWTGWTRLAPDIEPHLAVSDRPGQYSKHGLGLPLLIAAPWEVSGRSGAVAIVAACAVLLAGQMYLLGREAGNGPRLAAGVAAGLALTMPITPYALLLFPEVPSALLLVYAIRRVAAHESSTVQLATASAAIGFLPWLHQRFAVSAVILAAMLAWRFARSATRQRRLAAIAPLALGGVSLIGFNLWLYSWPIQPAENHDGFSSMAGTINGAFGLLLDAQWGLWVNAPVIVLAVGALPWWRRANPATFLVAFAAITPYLAILTAYSIWWGSWGPPARYLVPVVPLAAGPLAAWLARASLAGRLATAVALIAGAGLTLVGLSDPQRFYHQPDRINQLVDRAGEIIGVDIAPRLVAFQSYNPSPTSDRVAAAVFGAALTAFCILAMSGWTALTGWRSRPRLGASQRASDAGDGR